MARLTIRLSDERQQALKETAATSGKTISALIEESLDAYGIKTKERAETVVARARQRASLSESDALALANDEIRAIRQQQ